jgi:hypothetical protein
VSQVTPYGQELVPITTQGGGKMLVDKTVAQYAQKLVNDYESKYGPMKEGDYGGYNNRYIRGTHVVSNHAYGRAMDLGQGENAQGTKGVIDPEWATAEAKKYGARWGGNYQQAAVDPMHFEWPRGAKLPELPNEVSAYANAQPVTGGASPAMITNYGRHAPDSASPSGAPSASPPPASTPPGAFVKDAGGALQAFGHAMTPDDSAARSSAQAVAAAEAANARALSGDNLGAQWAAYLKSRRGAFA